MGEGSDGRKVVKRGRGRVCEYEVSKYNAWALSHILPPPSLHTHILTPPTHLPQDAETDLAVLIQIGIESHHPCASCHEPYTRGHEGVSWGETDNEVEESALIGRVKGTCDYHVQLCVYVCVFFFLCVCV